ncbi:MAG: hypothetical protein ACR2MM_03775 [Flavobacteriaceae bacterium]
MDRKTFIEKTMAVMLIALPAYALVGCSTSEDGGDEPDPNTNTNGQANCLANGTQITIGANHGHTLIVANADIQAGAERTYSIQGSSAHDHSITLTAANFSNLQNNDSITVSSTNDDGHTHSVTVRCA